VEEAAGSVAEGSKCRYAETLLRHPEMAVGARVARVLELAGEIRHIDPRSAGEGVIERAEKTYRESGREARDAGNLPPIDKTLGQAGESLCERYRIGVAPDEIVRDVKVRKRPAERVVRKVYAVVEEGA